MTCYLGKGVLWQNIVIIICLVTNNLVATKNKQKAFLTLENMNLVSGYGKIHDMYILPELKTR